MRCVDILGSNPGTSAKMLFAGETDIGVQMNAVSSRFSPGKDLAVKNKREVNMNWPLFFSIFSLIFIAELPDKTSFATLLLATRGRPLAIFLGVAGAFVIQSIVAVSFGSLIGMLPERWVHLGAGLMFIGFAYHTWFHHDEEEAKMEEENPSLSSRTKFFKSAWKAFLVIFIAEWGDLTQLATASIAAHYHDSLLTVFLAAIMALWLVTAITIFIGHRVKHVLHATLLKKVSTAVFVLVGFYFIWTWLKP